MARHGRPRRDLSFPSKLVKKANERLRKLESIHTEFYFLKGYDLQFDFANLSSAYRDVKRYAEKQGSKTKPQIYRIDEETGAIRFMTKAQFGNLDEAGKKYYQDMLNQFLENKTSTKIGVEQAYLDAYESFKKNHPQYDYMSFADYMDTWKAYDDKVKADDDNHFSYSTFQMMINNGQFNRKAIEDLTPGQVEKTLHYMGNISAATTDGKGGRFVNEHNPLINSSMKGVKYRGINGKGR